MASFFLFQLCKAALLSKQNLSECELRLFLELQRMSVTLFALGFLNHLQVQGPPHRLGETSPQADAHDLRAPGRLFSPRPWCCVSEHRPQAGVVRGAQGEPGQGG